MSHLQTHRTAPARYHTHTHTPRYCRVGLWDVVLKRRALKSNILQPVFNLLDDGALMESGAACSCLQSALDDYEAAFVSAVLFFLIISIHVVLYIFLYLLSEKCNREKLQAAPNIYESSGIPRL